ncbi:MAG TPA: TetR/AcrR family transcriptional regulator [Actinomycetota bacterium]|nr:TetR/AcrR family transcriptional regulator [Actinomycetota bacterium]
MTPPKTVKPKRAEYLGPARRRPLVLDAALELFAQGGFADASMEALARLAGTTKPVLYDCFSGGKQEIYFALLEREEERFRAHMMGVLATTGRMKLRDALTSGLSAFLDYADVNPSAFRVMFGPPGTSDPGIVERGVRVREQIITIMTDRADALAEPVNAPPVVVELYNRAIVAVAEELARWWLAAKPMERDKMVAVAVTWMMKGFEGILPAEWTRA